MIKSGIEKKKELDANKIIKSYIYNLRIKVDEAVTSGVHYSKVQNVEVASWNIIDCLVEHEIINNRIQAARPENISTRKGTPKLDVMLNGWIDENADGNSPKAGKKRKKIIVKVRDKNKKISDCIFELSSKVEVAEKKGIYLARVVGVNKSSWKFIDCLVEDEIVDESVQLVKHMKWTKAIQGSPVAGNLLVERGRTQVSSEKKGRSKSVPRIPQIGSPRDCQKRLDFNDDDEDGYDQRQYVCNGCEIKKQHMNRYRAERNELRGDKERLEKYIDKLAGERNHLAKKLQKIELEKSQFEEQIVNLETQLLNAESDETLKTKSLENTITYLKKFIFEIEERENLLKNALKDAKQDSEYHKDQLEIYREEKNDAKTSLSTCEIEKEKLQLEVAQLQKSLQKQKQKAEEQINNFKVKEKQKELQEDELHKKLKAIERKRKELPFRDQKVLLQQKEDNKNLIEENRSLRAEVYEYKNGVHTKLLQQQENNGKLNEENESLRAEIYKLENKHDRELLLEQENRKWIEVIESLRTEIYEVGNKHAEERKKHIDIQCKLEHEISSLKIKNSEADEQVRNMGKKLEEVYLKFKEQPSRFEKEEKQLRKIKELRIQFDEKSKSTEQRCYSSVGSQSDTEKENISLKFELTEALKSIQKLRQDYSDLANRYEKENIATKRTIESLQREKNCLEEDKVNSKVNLEKIKSDLNQFKHEQVHKQASSHEKVDHLLQQNSKLDNDRESLRGKIFSLENDQIKLVDKLNKSTEDNKKLQREQDKLQDKLRENTNELKTSETRIRKLEADILFFQNIRTENELLKESLRDLEEVKREFDNIEKRYKKETSDRISSDNTSTKYKEENDRLRKERNSAKIELQRVLRENTESYQNLNTEQVLAREELQSREREKLELVALFKDKENKDLQKIKLYEKEIETLKSRCRDYNEKMRQSEHEIETLKSKRKDDNDKIQRFEHEIYTLKSSFRDDNDKVQQLNHENETLKSRCRDDKDKIQRLESEIETVKSRSRDDNNKMRQMEREIENLKSRLTGEKANQHSAYDVMQYKNDLETCKYQKKALEDERNELQKENNELENELQSLNSKLEQFKDSARNISNLKNEIKDHEEGYRKAISNLHEAERQIQEKNETIEDQKEENRKINKEKKDLENKLRLALNNEEQASLGKECEDLKILLQQKQKELNNLKSRFQELADSKETSEVLNKIIENLQQEKSDLNQRLQELEVLKRQVNKLDFENSELKKRLHQYEDKFEDIPALKRHMNTVQSDNDKLNLKLQEYAAELEGIPSLKRRIENLQTDNAELEKRGKHKDGLLQKSESTVQKMQKDNQKLQTEIISQNQNYDTLKIKLESLKDKNLELDERLRRRSPVVVAEPKNCQNCFKYRNDISDLKREINDLRDRLSEAAGNKLRDNNPNIADLSDMNRPTSLAEKFSSLYTDEYTDAMEVIEDDMDEAASVKVMLDWLKSCYEWCQRLAKEQRNTLINRSIGFMEEHGGQNVKLSDRCLIFVKEFQKKIAVESLAVVGQICHVKSITQQTLSSEKYIVKYIKKCSELCWMMQISDPPLYLNFEVNSGENLNKNDYNVFTKSGSKIDYLVWPVLYLHKTGPMLAKGVAQGK